MDFFYLNRLSGLHDGKKIFFCKTDFIIKELEFLSKLEDDVILITGNSDYAINDDVFYRKPLNIKKWFAQNALFKDDVLMPLPIGLENKLPSKRDGHGIGYFERVAEKERLLSRGISKTPTKKIYANFNINTNYVYRSKVREKCLISPHIDWEEPNLTLEGFFDKILDYEMVVCPAGNGVDTHRLWEVLYSNRIPITIKMGDFKIYELYEKLPIIILDRVDDLRDEKLIDEKKNIIDNKVFDLNILNSFFWENEIKKSNV